jgi:hypothetical protein
MKRIWNAIGKTAKDGKFQSNAIKQVEKIETGSVKIAAPKQAAEMKRFELAQKDSNARKVCSFLSQTLLEEEFLFPSCASIGAFLSLDIWP